ncbi:hypothetical protein [Streptomyces sp. NPDC000410]|uniref:hypothetical protein n=1 Tax=Streptomyces sp. NPDC000410 TaxID=3154254 RepID=UPI00331AB764
MSNKKDTVKAAKAEINRDKGPKIPERTQGTLTDRHMRNHTPDRLYGDDAT